MPNLTGSGAVTAKSGSPKQPRPLVGSAGAGNSITVERRPGGIDCRFSIRTYLFILVATFLFGPALEALLLLRPDKISPHTPRLIMGAVWFLSLLALASFLRYAFGRPRFSVDFGTGEIKYFAWWGSRPSLTLQRGEIQGMEVEERVFLDEGKKVPNYCLTVTMSEGKRHALCVSTDRELVETLKNDLVAAGFGGDGIT